MSTRRICLLALAAAASFLAAGLGGDEPAPAPEAIPGYVGAARCAECHQRLHARWRGGRHSRMLQPAGAESVKGDFARGRLVLRGLEYGLRTEAGAYFIRESYLEGRAQERRVDFTLGSRRIQHYLTTLPDGRIVVLPPSWDVERRQWFHNLEIVDPEETSETRVQVWNANCVGCHVSPHERNYAPATATYASRWTDFGTGCERCHGPGRDHAAFHAAGAPAATRPAVMVKPTTLGPEGETMVCAQCHSLRDVSAPGYVAGADYFDHFLPILEYAQKADADPAYWADGRPRRFSNDALGLWQSACHLRGGATCTTCHLDPHEPDIDRNPQLAPARNDLCLRCHEAIGARLEAHTRHPAQSAGSSCVECHMPPTVVSVKARIRDHAIGVPAPEATRRFGIPNACNECHRERDAAWAERALASWGVARAGRRTVARAEAFRGAARGEAAALPALLALALNDDASEPPLVRANAVGHLRRYRDPRVGPALVQALRAEAAVVRAVAAMTLAEAGSTDEVRAALVGALGDPRRVVRVGAAFALVNRGVTRLPGPEGARLERAKSEYVRRADLLPDHAPTQLTLGQFLFLDRAYESASRALEAALRLEPALPGGRYFLGLARLGQGRPADARSELGAVPRHDPHYEDARRVLGSLEAASPKP